jgi:hypothetical protein
MRENLTYGLMRVPERQGDGLLERETRPKGEKHFGLTRPVHNCALVLLYRFFVSGGVSKVPFTSLRGAKRRGNLPAYARNLGDCFAKRCSQRHFVDF